jgi:glycosyltransferase involved in cell wall biosynthesis
LKLLIAGNLVNYGYFLTKNIREHGIDAHLLMEKYPKKSQDPLYFENNLLDYPEWIEFWDNKNWNWKYQIIKKMRRFDLIQSSTELPIFSLFSEKPNISFTTGSDIIELAQENSIRGFLLRLAYRKSKLVIFPGLYMYKSIKKLKIKNALFIPPLWDYNKFYSQDVHQNKESKFTIFHPTGHTWHQKGNNIFMKAFVRISKNYPKVHLIMVKRGDDFQKSKMILDKENLQDKVTIILDTIPQNKIKEYYNKSDVIVDQFVLGSTGLIGQEAMACEKPLIQFIDEELHKKFYPEIPPIMNASTEEQIYEKLVQLIEDDSLGRKIGKRSREWLLKYHDIEKIMKKYIFIYNAVNDKMKFPKILENFNSIL